jgi:hypothetical protein
MKPTVALAFLIPNGEMNSTTIQKVASQEFFGLEEKSLGSASSQQSGQTSLGSDSTRRGRSLSIFATFTSSLSRRHPRKGSS